VRSCTGRTIVIDGQAQLNLRNVTVAAVVLLVAGCATGSARTGADVVLEDLRFTPNRIDANVGVPMTIRLVNRGTQRHDLNFDSLHMPGLAGIEAILEPDEVRTVTVSFSEPGVHTFQCTLPGHAALGMTGALYVAK
jgi:Plastocyanin